MSTTYSSYRRQPTTDQAHDKYRQGSQQLKDIYPDWAVEDLSNLLAEVGGDIEVAAARISEGQVEQWGSVHRKKDKRHQNTAQDSKDRNVPRDRVDSRGGRGRGGRGGGRGGLSRGGAPGRGGQNGHRAQASSRNGPVDSTTPCTDNMDPSTPASKDESALSTSAWGSDPAPADQAQDFSSQATSTGWGESISGWGVDTKPNGVPSPAMQANPLTPVPGQPKPVPKTPATSKLSWAQVVRPQEKPAPTPPLAPVQLQPAPGPPSLPEQPPKVEEVVPPPEPEPPVPTAWEEPTTVQESTWEEEPQVPMVETQPEPASTPEPELKVEELPKSPSPEPVPLKVQEPVLSALPTQIQNQEVERSSTPTSAVKRPSSSAAHRHNARFRTGDQPVVMPTGNYTPNAEKIGMQFGSLNLGGDDLDSEPVPEPKQSEPEPAPEPKRVTPATEVKQPVQEPVQTVQPIPAPASAPVPVSQPPSISPTRTQTQQNPVTSTLFQQTLPQQVQQPSQQVQPHPIPASISQPSISQNATPALSSPVVSFTPQSQAVSQPSLANHHQPQTSHVPQQQSLNNNPTPSLYGQHELPSHLNPQTQVQPSPHAPQPQPSVASYTSHFRQQEAPYFHTPTPPASSQDSPYGAFGQLGQALQHQSQPSHTGFSADYGYNDRNNFYDSYTGQGGFNNPRNILGHDDLKGLTGPQTTSTLPSSNPQSSQQPSQTNSQPPPAGGQGPQQGYPHPVPYHYFPYQNQYYGSPYNSGYGVPQPFVKYPQMFQPGPPGPTSGSPVTKQAPSNVQHSNPYSQNLYGQQHPSNAYDDVGYHNQHQNVGGTLPGNDYKQLYGNPGLQGFMGGLGQSSGGPSSTGGAGGGPQGITQRPGGSPENSFKSYGGPGKDMGGVGAGQNIGVGQGGPQGRLGGVQQPTPGSGFYGAGGGRFGGGTGSGPQVQQSQQHQTQGQNPQLGYPQAGSEGGSFYSYQRGQQYWQ